MDEQEWYRETSWGMITHRTFFLLTGIRGIAFAVNGACNVAAFTAAGLLTVGGTNCSMLRIIRPAIRLFVVSLVSDRRSGAQAAASMFIELVCAFVSTCVCEEPIAAS